MTKVKLNPALVEIRGMMAGIVYRIRYGKQTMSKPPNMKKVKWSKAQREHRRRFRLAVSYAHRAMADARVSAIYRREAKQKDKRPFDLAVSDYFKGRNLLAG
ncbi:MAG TPA: hypothetical protein VK249_06120 [Anaerolineales bacterium]|nr:hypothetical protein [Anaerolineales bacterium]